MTPRIWNAFTLIELLVVVSIIAVLIALLLPGLKQAQEVARGVLCAANQHSIGTAMMSYTGDNDQRYPYATALFPDEDAPWSPSGSSAITWDDLLGAGYDGRNMTRAAQLERGLHDVSPKNLYNYKANAIYQCPDDVRSGDDMKYRRSYGINGATYGPPPNADGGWGPQASLLWGISNFYTSGGVNSSLSAQTTDVPAPSSTFALGESFMHQLGQNLRNSVVTGPFNQQGMEKDSWGYPLTPWHSDRTRWNYLFCDLHVEMLDPDATVGTGTNGGPPDNRPNRSAARGMWTVNPND